MFSNMNVGFKAEIMAAKFFAYVMVVVIIAAGVVIPVVSSIIDAQNFTGVIGTMMNLIPLFIGLSIVLIIASIMD